MNIEENQIRIKNNDPANLKFFEIDFSEMTDTFMTACIFAAINPHICKIFNIKN